MRFKSLVAVLIIATCATFGLVSPAGAAAHGTGASTRGNGALASSAARRTLAANDLKAAPPRPLLRGLPGSKVKGSAPISRRGLGGTPEQELPPISCEGNPVDFGSDPTFSDTYPYSLSSDEWTSEEETVTCDGAADSQSFVAFATDPSGVQHTLASSECVLCVDSVTPAGDYECTAGTACAGEWTYGWTWEAVQPDPEDTWLPEAGCVIDGPLIQCTQTATYDVISQEAGCKAAKVNNPHESNHAPENVNVTASITCNQSMPNITFTVTLYDYTNDRSNTDPFNVNNNTYLSGNSALPCLDGEYQGYISGTVTYGPNYDPSSADFSGYGDTVNITCTSST